MKRKSALLATPAYAPIVIVDGELRLARLRALATELNARKINSEYGKTDGS